MTEFIVTGRISLYALRVILLEASIIVDVTDFVSTTIVLLKTIMFQEKKKQLKLSFFGRKIE